MPDLNLSLAVAEYDHVRDIATGAVRAAGINITTVHGAVEDILIRAHWYNEWDVAETGLGAYVARLARGEQPVVAIPVFTSRVFRHSSIYVRADAGIKSPADLIGKRIGMPEWGMAAAVYARGMLMDQYGFDLKSVKWFQGGLHEPGRKDRMAPRPGFGLNYTNVTDRSLNDMLLSGDIDVLISARAPNAMMQGDPRVRYLFEDMRAEELKYWKQTGICPIMHFIAIRRDVYEKNRWVAVQLLKAFEEAKNRSLVRARDITASYFPVPLMNYTVQEARAVGGDDFWPYGIEKNRVALEAFLRYADEQGVSERRVTLEEMFAPECYFATKT